MLTITFRHILYVQVECTEITRHYSRVSGHMYANCQLSDGSQADSRSAGGTVPRHLGQSNVPFGITLTWGMGCLVLYASCASWRRSCPGWCWWDGSSWTSVTCVLAGVQPSGHHLAEAVLS